MDYAITDPESLQDCVGKLPAPRDMKVISFLDEHAQRWLSLSPIGLFLFGHSSELHMTLAGGAPAFAQVTDARSLCIPRPLFEGQLPNHRTVCDGAAFASLFLVPGMKETLRINGLVTKQDGHTLALGVRECFLHCGKALLRSDFWEAEPVDAAPSTEEEAFAQIRMLAVGTLGSEEGADVSPKGDPAGFLLRRVGDTVAFADRPGNRRIDSFRNILSQPEVRVLALIPGCSQLMEVRGQARLTKSPAALGAFTVQGKTPRLITQVTADSLRCWDSDVLKRVELWPAPPAPKELRASDIFRDHIKLSSERGFGATAARTAVPIPGLMKRGLKADYKNNLY